MKKVKEQLVREANQKFPGLIAIYPPSTYVAHLKRYPQSATYWHLCDSLRDFCQIIESKYSHSGMALVHKLVMLHFILHPEDRINTVKLTPELESFVKHEHERIISEFSSEQDEFYTIKNDKFIKDLALCTGRLIYGGAPVLEPYSIIPKKLVISSGPLNTMKIMKNGGFGPYFQVHTSDKHLQDYNEQGWDGCYKRVANLLELNPQFRGIIGSAWFYDPAIAEISPRLKYLRARQFDNGAMSIFMSEDKESELLATRTSPTRKALFDSGKYIPKQYMLVWSREDIIRWAKASK